MRNLKGRVIEIYQLDEKQKEDMFSLMDTFYENMDRESFEHDLKEKDICILLEDETGTIEGFSTQRILSFPLGGQQIHGVFSGDTVIHKDCWGSPELFKTFARYFFRYGESYDSFYWFLISKGYKTYKMLPAFFKEFYPTHSLRTPECMKDIMDAFGRYLYPEDYDSFHGVMDYRKEKDRLRPGVADISENRLRDPDIRYFVEKNPGYLRGNDLVCITNLKKENLKDGVGGRLF